MQTLDIPLALNDIKIFDIGGSYFEFIEGAGAVDINFVNADGSRSKDLEMLDALPGYWVGGSFSRFELKNKSGGAQTVRVMFGSGVGGSRRIQGNVRVIDSAKALTVANQAFAFALTAGPVAAQYSRAGVWLPAGSTKRLIIENFEFSTSGPAASFIIGQTAVAPGTIDATIQNKLLGGAGPAQARRGYDTAAAFGVNTLVRYDGVTSGRMQKATPIVVGAGQGLLAVCLTVNQIMSANIEFIEEDAV